MTTDHLAAERTIEVVEAELESAMLRLGTLGCSPKMPHDLADLCARLGAMGSHGFKDYPTHSINPDGEEAAAAIEMLLARLDRMTEAVEECRRLAARRCEVRQPLAIDIAEAESIVRMCARALGGQVGEG